MARTWKIVLGLALALPMLAYVSGSLIAAGDEPTDRSPIEFMQDRPSGGDSTPGKTGQTDRPGKNEPDNSGPRNGPDKNGPGKNGPDAKPGDKGDQGSGKQTTQKPDTSGSPEVIKPRPRDLDDDDWDDDDDDDGDDDDD